jgi:hypothetical protein
MVRLEKKRGIIRQNPNDPSLQIQFSNYFVGNRVSDQDAVAAVE